MARAGSHAQPRPGNERVLVAGYDEVALARQHVHDGRSGSGVFREALAGGHREQHQLNAVLVGDGLAVYPAARNFGLGGKVGEERVRIVSHGPKIRPEKQNSVYRMRRMEEQAVRQHARDYCAALVAGDVDRAAQELSNELRSNLGQVVTMLPMPLTEATVESLERTPTGYRTVLRLVGESSETHIETRWKERDGRPAIVEVSHLTEQAPSDAAGGPETIEPEA
jgi:hypothetical protein